MGLDDKMLLSHHLLVWALPCQLGILAVWAWVRRGIRKDIRRALAGETPHNGIPHHGLLLLVALRQFVLIGMNIYQVMLIGETGGFAFMMGDIACSGMTVLSIYTVARMERGIVTEVVAGNRLFSVFGQ